LIAGGYDKHLSYAPLVPYILNKVSHLILTGDTSENIYKEVVNNQEYRQEEIVIRQGICSF
jgi:UDP-N-acetylmuramoylalanine--D-glutamate ligase